MAAEPRGRPRRGRRPWKRTARSLLRRLLCCSGAEENDRPPGRETPRTDGDPQDGRELACGERGVIHITVEDLGVVNPSFSPTGEEDDPRARGRATTRSASPRRVLKKKRLKALSSLPLQVGADRACGHTSEDGDEEGEEEEEEEDPMLFEMDSSPASGSLLTPPAINLIPPTPSDVVDDDLFFSEEEEEEEECVTFTSGSDASYAPGDRESDEETTESRETDDANKDFYAEAQDADDREEEPEERPAAAGPESAEADAPEETEEEREREKERDKETEKPKLGFLRSVYQVVALPEHPQKRSFNTGINLLSFTEHNLDDPGNQDAGYHELLKAQLRLLPPSAQMETFTHLLWKPAVRSCSLGDELTRGRTLRAATPINDAARQDEGLPRQRRITVASYMPQSKDRNGNFAEKDLDKQQAKSLRELNTDEVCQWFSIIGLQKCLPFIKEANLCGADMASVDVNTLDLLHISTLEEREQLLSAIYRELHPPSTTSQRLDSLMETFGPNNVERFTAALVSMSKSKSSPHVSCLYMNRSSVKLRNRSHGSLMQRNSQLMEITINASEQIVHLRTPKETMVGKVMESCIKTLGLTEDKDLFTLKDKQGSSEELSPELQIGGLVTSENRQLELQLCKKEKLKALEIQDHKTNGSQENGPVNQNLQESLPGKEEKIKELNQQVESLQNVILQVQELHHDLVAFCSELKSTDGEVDVSGLSSAELSDRLDAARGRLTDRRRSLQTLREATSNAAAHRSKQSEVRLLDKIKLNCQVFKEEISLVHLNRQVAHLQTALQDCRDKEKAQRKCSSLGQLVSPQCPAMLLVVQEHQGPDGRYGFTCRFTQGRGLVVVQAEHSHLCLDDRLVEVNGEPVVGYSEQDLRVLLLQRSSAQIVVLRKPPHMTPSRQQQQPGNPDNLHSISPESDAVSTATAQLCELMAI